VVFSVATIERFVATGTQSFTPATRRTLRTNLRFLRESQGEPTVPRPAALPRNRAKRPYSNESNRGRSTPPDNEAMSGEVTLRRFSSTPPTTKPDPKNAPAQSTASW
jgi:hypothetical protein